MLRLLLLTQKHMQSWGGTSDAFCTQGRVKKGANTYAILSQAKPAYNKVEYRTPGTYTFTVPVGVTSVKVTIAGAGGGGGGYAVARKRK